MRTKEIEIIIISLLITSLFVNPLLSQTATKLSILDTRTINTGPNGFGSEIKAEFKQRSTIGVPGTGTYSGLLTIAPWMQDNSGNKHHQLNFNDGGIFYRTGLPQDVTWGAWSKLVFEDPSGNAGIGGNLGVGTLTPNSKIEVKSIHGYNQDDEIRIGSYYNNNFNGLGFNYRINSVGNPSKHLIEYTAGTRYDLMTFTNGRVGIGTSNPTKKLHVSGDPGYLAYLSTTNGTISESASILFQGGRGVVGYDGVFQGMRVSTSDYSKSIIFTNSLTDGAGELMRIKGTGNVGIGTSTPLAKLHINSGANNNYAAILATSNEGNNLVVSSHDTQPHSCTVFKISHEYSNNPAKRNNGYISFYRGSSDEGGFLELGTYGVSRMLIDPNGRVGIGTSTPDEMLTVNGKIHAKEVIVALTGPLADYVFEPDYRLKPLHEVEQFVKTNKHLPGIPSAAQVEKKGLSMGEMQNKMLQKIEELTLYIIG